MRAFVTGGTGFIGGAVVRHLVAAGHEVRALVRSDSDTRQLDSLPVDLVRGDLRDRVILDKAMAGCQWVFHVAALFSYWGHSWREFHATNVEGTRRVLEAARQADVQRIVYTSSIVTLALHSDGSPATEDHPLRPEATMGHYQRSKIMAEEAVLAMARQGLPVVIVNPSAPVGIGDHKPTPTGQMIVDFLNGRLPAYVETGLNIVDVDDVAAGHLLAAERGRVGERYILGGENLPLKTILDLLAELSGWPRVGLRIPYSVALAWGYADTALARLIPHRTPTATPEKVRYSHQYAYVDSSKAVRELGLPQTPAREALRKAIEWYRAHGYAR